MKDPYVLEFLGLPELPEYAESELESRIIDHLQQFLLELGTGFAFIGRQVRFRFSQINMKLFCRVKKLYRNYWKSKWRRRVNENLFGRRNGKKMEYLRTQRKEFTVPMVVSQVLFSLVRPGMSGRMRRNRNAPISERTAGCIAGHLY
ncbi:MAG: PDDEXK nuclease domain-containing protein [Lachnospiraceae bacterium]